MLKSSNTVHGNMKDVLRNFHDMTIVGVNPKPWPLTSPDWIEFLVDIWMLVFPIWELCHELLQLSIRHTVYGGGLYRARHLCLQNMLILTLVTCSLEYADKEN